MTAGQVSLLSANTMRMNALAGTGGDAALRKLETGQRAQKVDGRSARRWG